MPAYTVLTQPMPHKHGRSSLYHACVASACVITIAFFVSGRNAFGTDLPEPVLQKIDSLGAIGTKAAIVRTGHGPWLVAAATAGPGDKCLPRMQHDCAARAAIVEAKRAMAETLAADIAVFVQAGTGIGIDRTVIVSVSGQVLSRVQLVKEAYDPEANRCRVVIASAPAGAAVREGTTFPDAETAAKHMLERASSRLCAPGVVCAQVAGSTDTHPKLVFIAIAIAPRSANGQHEVSNAKAQALLVRFWREQLESRVTLEQKEIPDPSDPGGSILLNYDQLTTWAANREANRLPGFKSSHLGRDDMTYTALWCTN